MTKALYEKIDEEKLEKVLKCNNLPTDYDDDGDDDKVKQPLKVILQNYSKIPNTKYGRKIVYSQNNGYARFSCKYGAQGMKREVRKYLFKGTHIDIDIVNCHPVLLEQIFEKHNMICKQLKDYNADRKQFLVDNKIKDKTVMLKALNTDYVNGKTKVFEETNVAIYKNLLPILLNDDANKTRLKSIISQRKKDKKDYNHKGAFFSKYLQNIENDILMCMTEYALELGFVVASYIYDGFLIEKNDEASDEFLLKLERRVEESLGWKIKLVFESLETDWEPCVDGEFDEDEDMPCGNIIDLEYISNFSFKDENGKDDIYQKEQFVKYLNNYACEFEFPLSYGYRTYKNVPYQIVNYNILCNRIGNNIKRWNMSNIKLRYMSQVFIVDKNDPRYIDEKYYNIYKAPSMKKTDKKSIKEICPELHDYLYRLIVRGNDKNYNALINYFAKMKQVGRTCISLILLGERGIGKSTVVFFCGYLVGKDNTEYTTIYKDITDLENRFNADSLTNIVIAMEEITSNAGEYHKVQNKIKSLITEKQNVIERKGQDRFKTETLSNYIFLSNNDNPIHITPDNRRFFCFDVSTEEQRKVEYFINLKKKIVENIEELRYFFDTYQYDEDLFGLYEKTQAEFDLVNINKHSVEQFLEDKIIAEIDVNDNSGKESNVISNNFDNVYQAYTKYCSDGGLKKTNKQYFSKEIQKHGYEVYRCTKTKERYIIRKNSMA
jgi:hypothetical protein